MPTVEEITSTIHAFPAKERERLLSAFKTKQPLYSQDFTNLYEVRFSAGLFCAHCGCSEKESVNT